ncbi:MAG: cytochrome P450 [Hyphomicrobiales bacterium]|nr:MAG: cytochrome P450 [Hyphomicrobiales bacterium]
MRVSPVFSTPSRRMTDGLLHRLGLQVLFPLNPKVHQDAIDAGRAAAAEFVDYITERLAEVRARGMDGPPNSVLEAVIAAESDGAALTPEEGVHMCLLVVNGGHETTTNLIAVGTYGLLQHRDEFARLPELDDRSVNVAVEEIIRYVSPLQLQGRRTTIDMDLPSGFLPAGTEVVLCQAAANRDENEFTEPDRLNLSRKPNPHVAFGLGVHACLGNQLARLEARVVLPRLARRLPDLALDGAPPSIPPSAFEVCPASPSASEPPHDCPARQLLRTTRRPTLQGSVEDERCADKGAGHHDGAVPMALRRSP